MVKIMFPNTYKFVDKIIKITTIYHYFHLMAKDYLSSETYTIEIVNSLEEIKEALMRYKSRDEKENLNNLDYIESLLILEKLATLFNKDNTFIFHGSSFYIDDINNGFIITAKSGVGKSTHARLLKEYLNQRFYYINDDKPFIHFDIDNYFYLYGSAWDGKEKKSSNVKAKLKGIFILYQNKTNEIKRITADEAINYLFKQIYIPESQITIVNTMHYIIALAQNVPIYLLGCNISLEAAKLSYKTMEELM